MCSKIVFCWTLLLLATAAAARIDKIKNVTNQSDYHLITNFTNFLNSTSPSFHPPIRDYNLKLPESRNRSRDNDASDSSLPQSLTDVNDVSSMSDIDESQQPDAARYYNNEYYRDCGKLEITRFKRIIGGHDSSLGRIPWQVALFRSIQAFVARKPADCGGVLLSDKWIITAAHCVKTVPSENLTVLLGVNDIHSESEQNLHRTYKVKRKEVHPEYDNVGYRNDIALLRVDGSVRFDWHIIPICLPSQDLNPFGQIATVSGWGRTVAKKSNSQPTILQEVDVEVIRNDVCRNWLYPARNDVFLCAGYEQGGKDSCRGDSGGPLTISLGRRRVLIGIVSTGRGCGKKRLPGLYTNIRKFVPWIMEVTNQTSST